MSAVLKPPTSGDNPAPFPGKLRCLFQPARFKVLLGGRDAGRSWGAARALLTLGSMDPKAPSWFLGGMAPRGPLRILCCREIQSSIKDSVHALLKQQIELMGLQSFYDVLETSIIGANGTEFMFRGLRDLDPEKIKSFEGVHIAWCEEAESLSKRSFNILEPTIRRDGSELWFTFNPQLDSDFIYQNFVANKFPDSVVVHMTWKDNPWASKVLETGRERMRLTDYDEYENIWLGKPRTVVAGAIYAKEMRKLIESNRARPMPYDPALKVHTVWDLGWNDNMVIAMVQRSASAVMVIDYLEDQFKTYAECVAELDKRGYVWGTDWLPPDGKQTHPETGKSAKQTLQGLGRKSVKIIGERDGKQTGKLDVESGIKATRMMFPRLYIDNTEHESEDWRYSGPARLIECLKRYKRSVPASTGEPGAPVHDEFSHGADCCRGLAEIVDKLTNDDERPRPRFASYGVLDQQAGI